MNSLSTLSVIGGSEIFRNRLTAADRIAEAVRHAIQTGALADGLELSQAGLARHFGVSRVPVREALRALEAQGWVKAPTHQRAFVQALTPAEVDEVFRVRLLLEPDLIGRAVPRMTPSITADLFARSDAMDALNDHALWVAANREFHQALLAPAQAPFRLRLVETLTAQVERYLRLHHADSHRQSDAGLEHRAIVEAARKKDVRAARTLLSQHIRRSRDGILAAFRKRPATGELS